jgi:hypothetical protein
MQYILHANSCGTSTGKVVSYARETSYERWKDHRIDQCSYQRLARASLFFVLRLTVSATLLLVQPFTAILQLALYSDRMRFLCLHGKGTNSKVSPPVY